MSGDGTQSARVELTVRDLRQYSGHAYKKQFGRIGVSILCSGPFYLGVAGVFLLTAFQHRIFRIESGPLLLALIVVLMYFTWLASSNYIAYSLWKRQNFVRQPTDFQLTADGVEWDNDVASGRYDWSGIATVDETKEHILLCLDGAVAHIIPKRAFDTPEAAQRFLETARGYWRAAREEA